MGEVVEERAGAYRFQVKRGGKGFQSPPGGIVCTRNSHLGNPYKLKEHGGPYEREEAVRLCCEDILADRGRSPLNKRRGLPRTAPPIITRAYVRRYRGRPMGCTCALDELCHVDELLRIANAPLCEEV
jgi:hypothetical protein